MRMRVTNREITNNMAAENVEILVEIENFKQNEKKRMGEKQKLINKKERLFSDPRR